MKRICWISLIVAGAGLLLALTMFFAGASIGARITADGVELVGGPVTAPELSLVAQTGLDAVKTLDIRVDSADVQVVEGDGYALELWSYQTAGKYQLNYEFKDGNLTVWDIYRGQRGGWQMQFGFHFPQSWTNPGEGNNRVIVTLPAGALLDTADISCSIGSVSTQGVSAARFGVTCSFGKVNLVDSTADTVNLNLNSGELTLDGIEAGDLVIRNNFGSVTLHGAGRRLPAVSVKADSCDISLGGFSADRLEIKNSFGEVKLDNLTLEALAFQGDSCDLVADRVSVGAAEIKDNFGAVTATAWSSCSLELDGDSCTVNIDGALRGRTDIDNNFGAVTLRTDLPRDEYSLDIAVDFGKANIDGASVGGEYHEEAGGRSHHIEVENSSGDVTLLFGAA